ncbi:MAG TPA: hypothetical protein VFH54_01980 [Mycobacteriales bacterium]|nr:hypothetical protein [Mycobacteriales bacterium]
MVEVLDPCGSVVTLASDTTVSLTDSAGVLNAAGSSVTVNAGNPATFTFGNVTFSAFGINDDTLTASSAPLTPTTSNPFDIVQKLVPCPAGQTCTTGNIQDTPTNPTTIVNITAFAGAKDVLTATLKGKPGGDLFPNCTAEPFYGSVVTFNVTTRGKTVTMTLPKAYVNLISNNGTPFMDICLALDTGTFVDKFGNTVTNGFLANCSATVPVNTPPCINSRGKNAANEVITFTLPAGDPHTAWG